MRLLRRRVLLTRRVPSWKRASHPRGRARKEEKKKDVAFLAPPRASRHETVVLPQRRVVTSPGLRCTFRGARARHALGGSRSERPRPRCVVLSLTRKKHLESENFRDRELLGCIGMRVFPSAPQVGGICHRVLTGIKRGRQRQVGNQPNNTAAKGKL